MQNEYKNKSMSEEKITFKQVFNFPKHSVSFKATDITDANKQLKEYLKGKSIKVNKSEVKNV